MTQAYLWAYYTLFFGKLWRVELLDGVTELLKSVVVELSASASSSFSRLQ